MEDFEKKLTDSAKASTLLDYITIQAEKFHLNVIQMYTDSPLVIKDDFGKELECNGKKLLWLPVSLRVESDYKSFATFLRSMVEESKTDFLVESFQIQRTSNNVDSLQCDITFSFVAT